jgi:hypothetical protein
MVIEDNARFIIEILISRLERVETNQIQLIVSLADFTCQGFFRRRFSLRADHSERPAPDALRAGRLINFCYKIAPCRRAACAVRRLVAMQQFRRAKDNFRRHKRLTRHPKAQGKQITVMAQPLSAKVTGIIKRITLTSRILDFIWR